MDPKVTEVNTGIVLNLEEFDETTHPKINRGWVDPSKLNGSVWVFVSTSLGACHNAPSLVVREKEGFHLHFFPNLCLSRIRAISKIRFKTVIIGLTMGGRFLWKNDGRYLAFKNFENIFEV